MAPRQSPSTTTPSRHRGKQRKSRQAQRGRSAAGGGMSVKHLCRYLRRSPPSPAASGHLLGSGHLLCPDPNHDPRYVILESPTCNRGERPSNWFVIGFHYVNDYRAAVRTQNTQRDFNNTGKSRGVTDSANAFGSVSPIRPEVFGPAKDIIAVAVGLRAYDQSFSRGKCRRDGNYYAGLIHFLLAAPLPKTPPFDFVGLTRRHHRLPFSRTAMPYSLSLERALSCISPILGSLFFDPSRTLLSTVSTRRVSMSPDRWRDI
jgi:hypothetical protein